MGLRITPCDPRVILRGLFWGCVILMMEMILGGNSYETSCWKWSSRYSETPDWVWDMTMVILGVILGVILRVVYVILMTEMVLGGDSYEESCWKWSSRYNVTTDSSMGNHHVILRVILG